MSIILELESLDFKNEIFLMKVLFFITIFYFYFFLLYLNLFYKIAASQKTNKNTKYIENKKKYLFFINLLVFIKIENCNISYLI